MFYFESYAAGKALDALIGSKFAQGDNCLFPHRQAAIDFLDNMLAHKIFHRAKKVPVSEQELKGRGSKKSKEVEKEKEGKDKEKSKGDEKQTDAESSHAEGKSEKQVSSFEFNTFELFTFFYITTGRERETQTQNPS